MAISAITTTIIIATSSFNHARNIKSQVDISVFKSNPIFVCWCCKIPIHQASPVQFIMTEPQSTSTGRPLTRLYHNNKEVALKWRNLCWVATMNKRPADCYSTEYCTELLSSWQPAVTSLRYRQRLSHYTYLLVITNIVDDEYRC